MCQSHCQNTTSGSDEIKHLCFVSDCTLEDKNFKTVGNLRGRSRTTMKYDCCYSQVLFTQHSAVSGELLSHNRKKGKRKISDINKTRRRSVTAFCKQSSTPVAKNSSKRSQTARNLFPSKSGGSQEIIGRYFCQSRFKRANRISPPPTEPAGGTHGTRHTATLSSLPEPATTKRQKSS